MSQRLIQARDVMQSLPHAQSLGMIVAEMAEGSFLILPHEMGRMAWALKQKNPQALYDEMASMAEKMRSKARSTD